MKNAKKTELLEPAEELNECIILKLKINARRDY